MGLISAKNSLKRELKPLTGMNASQWFSSMFGSYNTDSGEIVNADTAVSLSTVHNAIRLLSETVAQIPVNVYSLQGDVKRLFNSHRAFNLIAKKPNEYMTAFTFNKVLVNHMARYDNAFALIERNGFKHPISLIPIHPERVSIKITESQEKFFEVDGQYLIKSMDMIHLMDYTEDGIVGKSKIKMMKQALGNSIAAERFTGQFFGKGVNVSGFIKHKKYLKDNEAVERLKKSFVKSVTGSSFGVGLLEDDMDWIPNEVNPQSAQLTETRKVNALVVAQIWNIPLPLLKVLDNATYNNVEQLDIQFGKYTIAPYLVNFEQEYEDKLLTEVEKRNGETFIEHDMTALLRGDMETQGKFFESMTKTGAYSPNDIRKKVNENPYDGGDIHIVPSGYQTVEQITNGQGNGNN